MKKIILALAALGFCAESMAGYGSAGCGLGSMLFEGKNQWYEQVLAATTNGTSGNQTFGITFGSLNCDAAALVGQNERASVFVAANKNAVINELSMGRGESVSVLAELFNCENKAQFGATMKANYRSIVTESNMTAENIVENISRVTEQTNVCRTNLG